MDEWTEMAPTFKEFILKCGVSKRAASNDTKKIAQRECKLVMAGCLLLFARSNKMSAAQYFNSLIMAGGNCDAMVYRRLNAIGVCMSHTSVMNKLDNFTAICDKPVRRWKSDIEQQCIGVTATVQTESSISAGYSVVFDNLDLNKKARHMTGEHRNQDFHFVNTYAVKDRVNCENLPDDAPICDILKLPNTVFLPTAADHKALKSDFAEIIIRIIVQEMSFFTKHFSNTMVRHIPHTYSEESSVKSELIPLGILIKNECKTDECIDVLKFLHQYVPGSSYQNQDVPPPNNDSLSEDERTDVTVSGDRESDESVNVDSPLSISEYAEITNENCEHGPLKKIVCTGDQLSVERAVNA
uniref:Uncharacterized protein LOC102803889 n=1 Tax=Saccoglossus kowalevskii TaxID=10224 RepID=A0ABM0M9M7_SACKO|nr:PREDICTED: uncharacterized protein LOC102803889 [Saccoglossus kowalevskii]